MKKLFFSLLFLSAAYINIYAQGETMFQVLTLPATAYDAAMASTFISGNASAVSNPSIAPFTGRCAAVSHSVYLEETSYTLADVNIPLKDKKSVLNFSFLYFDLGTMERTLSDGKFGYIKQGSFSANDKVLTASYGRKITDDLSYGISLKYVSQTIDDVSYDGFCVHISGLYFFSKDFYVAAGLNNFGADVSGYSMPSDFYIGVSGYINSQLMLVSQLDNFYNDKITNLKIALEYETERILLLRLGYIIPVKEERSSENEYITNLTCGIGLKFSLLSVDYAWLPKGDLGDTHTFTLIFKF